MVEPSQPQSQPASPVPVPSLADLVRTAERDEHTLALLARFNRPAVISDPNFPAYCLLRRQVRLFINHAPHYVACIVCAGREPAWWLLQHLPLELGRHCPAHAAGFHARVPLQPTCCAQLYHPLTAYSWRAYAERVRELEQQELQRPSSAHRLP